MRRVAVPLLLAALLAMAGCGDRGGWGQRDAPKFSTEYQAVFMQSGQVFFGKLELSSVDYATLRDVYFVQQQANPETKEVKGVLLKRASELHAPDVMLINARQIALIEPVTPGSRVEQLIKQAASPQGAPQQQ